MRKRSDSARAVRGRGSADAARPCRRPPSAEDEIDDFPPLTRAELRELDRRVRDLEDRTRYCIVSLLAPRFALYYNLSDDSWGMNEPPYATLFKRRASALAIRGMLGPGVEVVRCRVDRNRRLVKRSLPERLFGRRRARKGAA